MEDRLEIENDKQYLGYTCFRDLGLARTMEAAYQVYLSKVKPESAKKGREVNASFKKWRIDFDWDERIRAYDASDQDRKRTAAIEADAEAYTQGLARYNEILDNFANGRLAQAVRVGDALTAEMVQMIEQAGGKTGLDLDRVNLIVSAEEKLSKLVAVTSERLEKSLAISLLLTDLRNPS
jgi:hypothetical protein